MGFSLRSRSCKVPWRLQSSSGMVVNLFGWEKDIEIGINNILLHEKLIFVYSEISERNVIIFSADYAVYIASLSSLKYIGHILQIVETIGRF